MLRKLPIVLLLFAAAAVGEVFKWVDENGIVQYGDRPPTEGAEKVALPPSSVYTPRPLPAVARPDEGQPSGVAAVAYKRVVIRRPSDDATVRDNTGAVELAVELDPTLQPGHRMSVIIDGRTIYDQLEVDRVVLNDVDRGTHRLQVKVLDADGAEQAASQPVTFHMHRATVLTPSPAVRPRSR